MEQKSCLSKQVLWVNLSTREIRKNPALEYSKKFLGGRGVNYWFLLKELSPQVSALDPENILVLGTGALVGTSIPGANRLNVASKNILTGGIGSGSASGYFAPKLRLAGYDHLVIRGKAEKPVYLWINDGQVEIRDASHIWGKTTWEAESVIKEELGNDVRIVSIGPAGENLVKSACIIVDPLDFSRAVARCGLGAVMGSKKLKAIAVRGTNPIYINNEKKYAEVVGRISEKIANSDIMKRLKESGTLYASPYDAEPVKNFQDGYPSPEIAEKVCGRIFHEQYEIRRLPCGFCPVECCHAYEVKQGAYAGAATNKLEANTLADFGYRLNVDYAPAVIEAQSLCNQYGLDIDNTSSVIAWAFECYQNGIISRKDTDGLRLEWGNHQAVIELLKKIAYRDGFGNILAEGCYRASEIIGRGSRKYCIHVKGQDLMEEIRYAKGWALGVIVSERGGTHTRGAPLTDLSGVPSEVGKEMWDVPASNDPTSYTGKAKIVAYYERFHAVLDSLGICYNTTNWMEPGLPGPEDYAEAFSAASGLEISSEDLMRIGEQIHNIGKAFNILHAGFTRKDDYPPKRLLEEPVKSGPFKGARLSRDGWDKMLDEYYELHNWDKETSWCTRKGLEKLGLNDVASLLKAAGKLVE